MTRQPFRVRVQRLWRAFLWGPHAERRPHELDRLAPALGLAATMVLLVTVVAWLMAIQRAVQQPMVQAAFERAVQTPSPDRAVPSDVIVKYLASRRARYGYSIEDLMLAPVQQYAERRFAVRVSWRERRYDGYTQRKSCELQVQQEARGAWTLTNTRACSQIT